MSDDKKLSDIKINLNDMRVEILNLLREGVREMDLDTFLRLVHQVYHEGKDK